MILIDIDSMNVYVGIDLLQAKLLVEVLRAIDTPQLLDASAAVQQDGYDVIGSDALSAAQSFCSVVGFVTDKLIRPGPDSETSPGKPIDDGCDSVETVQ